MSQQTYKIELPGDTPKHDVSFPNLDNLEEIKEAMQYKEVVEAVSHMRKSIGDEDDGRLLIAAGEILSLEPMGVVEDE